MSMDLASFDPFSVLGYKVLGILISCSRWRENLGGLGQNLVRGVISAML